jgi:hypothetical protein
MNKFLIAAAFAVTSISTTALADDVGLSVSIGQPGFYGQLDLGNAPPPRVIYRHPKVVERGIPDNRPPVYLRVPPNQRRHWSRHCREYNACGERVYFVQDNWYNREYAPRYRKQHGDRRDNGRREHRNDERGNNNNDRQGGNRGQGREH